jgi:hypothetical protein
MSVIGGRAENICSFRVFLSLTLKGHLTTWITAKAFYAPVEHPKVWTNAPRREFMYCNDCWRRSLACENVGEPRGFEVIERGTAFAPFMGARGGPVTPDRDTGPRRRLN